MVIECYKIKSQLLQNKYLNVNTESKLYKDMDNTVCKISEMNKIDENGEEILKEYLDEKNKNELLKASNSWWPVDSMGGKFDSRQRWSFGSDTSIEAVENIQSRLCCSPVDEFDSTISSENEDLIVNSTDERDETFKDYIRQSPNSSPTFNKVICNSNSKKQNKNHDVDTADDELVDYSKRYTTDSSLNDNKHITSSDIQQEGNVGNRVSRHIPGKKTGSVNNRSKVDPFGDYAETDLDQPTDYSLRYAEEDTDEEEKENPQFYCTGEQEDTVKTYYTEGTPYQTPSNFSTATSMSDLLSLEDGRDGDELIYKSQFLKEQKQEALAKSVKDSRNRVKRKCVSKDFKSPKVIEERANISDQKSYLNKAEKLLTPPQSPIESCDKEKDNKAVTFNIGENYAQETPLMFSRSSSLDSLSEFEQRSLHDDRSSVISDFSQRTSAVVSPSELPDSPTQTVQPSPDKLKQHNVCNKQSQKISLRPNSRKPLNEHNQSEKKVDQDEKLSRHHEGLCKLSNRTLDHASVFEDGLVSFKEESLPSKLHSTIASSLSSLTIDEDEGNECDNCDIVSKIASIKVTSSAAGMHQPPIHKEYNSNSFNDVNKMSCQSQINKLLQRHSDFRNNCLLVSPTKEGIHFNNSEEDNEYRTVFINNEIQKNRYRDPLREESIKNVNRNNVSRYVSKSPTTKRNYGVCASQKTEVEEIIAMDTIRIYCTEDTPTYVSPYGSQSNLSALSMLSISDEDFREYEEVRSLYQGERSSSPADAYATDASSDFSDDDDRYNDEESLLNSRRRIDVSPFDSQMNLANFSLLCIEEESEEEEDEEVDNETDKSVVDDSCTENVNAYKRLLHENSDYSDEDKKVLEEFIKMGVSKVTRRRDDTGSN